MIKHADRIDRIELSGIRKINETALQMEREGAKLFTLKSADLTLIRRNISRMKRFVACKPGMFAIRPT